MSQEIIKLKKSFFHRFWWAILLIIVLSLIAVGYIKDHIDNEIRARQEGFSSTEEKRESKKEDEIRVMTAKEIQQAELALAAGIQIDDEQNDFTKLSGPPVKDEDGRYDNYNPYPLPYTDLKSVRVGADNTYVYFKFQFYGTFPKEMPSYEGDEIECTEAKVEDFGSSASGVEPYELHDYVIYGRYYPEKGLEKVTPQLDHYAFISTDTLMRGSTRAGMVGGGMGFDFILSAYPLSLFNLKLGDEVTFRATTETASAKYHHQDIDGAGTLSDSKTGIEVRYKLGENTYDTTGKTNRIR